MYTNEPGKDTNKTPTNSTNRTMTKRLAVKRIIILGIILAVGLTLSTAFLKPMLPKQYLIFLQVAQVSVIGYFVIEIIGNTLYKLAGEYIQGTAKSIESFIKIAGAIIVIAIIISYLSQDPLVAASISTISGLVVGFAAQNIIGNAIAGLYLAITRPFKIGDRITVFGNTGVVYDIGLLNSKLLTDTGDVVLAPNSSMVTTMVIVNK
jgi:small conductance mechanosensitive channel